MTDASGIAIAAALSQVQNGIERPLVYASRQLNKAESAYGASELEKLALVWAVKYFRCYLLGTHFVVRTDNAALTYLNKFADSNARLMRWSLKLAECSFTIEHKAGKKIPHVDALSRHVSTVLHGETLKDKALKEQAKDTFSKSVKPGSYTDRREYFLDDSGLIYKHRDDEKHQLLVPESLVKEVIKQKHNPVYIGHPGSKRTCDLIAVSFWWPGRRKSIEEYVKVARHARE
jgi:hypothetical protein